ncbi:hypothetical protein K8B33_02325 [Alcanivorax sp. JB21]|uniref:hypothetical protein n=1 Tax=Alcanivorax limicola TaxID=2874102 RepID=UPI001CBB734F|nr:hypothetical protein [Alcanivorax limicola]MBZ2187921.1 hypothetical protein [Alcanivorax limicola]
MSGISAYLRGLCAALLLMPVLLMPVVASAAINQAQVERMQLELWRVRADFHMFTVMDGDRRYERQLAQSLRSAESQFRVLQSAASSDTDVALVNAMRNNWAEFTKAAESNTIAKLGYTESYAAQDVNRLAAVMNNQLSTYSADSSGDYADMWALAAYMQRMSSEYLALSADPSGGMAVDTGEGRIEFRDTVPAFDRRLAEIRAKYRDDDTATRALDQIASKWGFIRESLVKFYENSVPFLVHRYTQQIVASVDQVAGS